MKTNARLLLIKAAQIPPGAHWITVHPNGTGKGQPVLIQPAPDGKGSVVIGGAGGSLNHLRLRAVKSKSDYKQEAEAKAADRRKAKQAQTAADKASGVHEAKQEARKAINQQRKDAERQVIQAVAKKAGWQQQDLDFPEDDYAHLSEKALSKVKDRHHKKLLNRAKDFIKQAREKLVSDASARQAAGIGEIPLFSTSPDTLSVEDLAPVKPASSSLGFNPDYKGRAEAKGLTDEALAAETQQVKLAGMTPEQRAAAMARGQAPNLIKQELEGIKEPAAPNADASLLSAQDALDLVKEGKRLAEIEKQAREATADVDKSAAEPKAFVLEAEDDAKLDQAAKDAVLNDLRTAQTVSFLSEVGKIAGGDPTETLGGHIGVGAYNSINALALAVGGEALVDRSVVDVLGIAGAAQVLARRLHSDLSPEEAQHVADGVQDWHLNHYMQTSTDAIKRARELTDAAAAIEPDAGAGTGHDLAVAQELNARRRAAVGDAQRIMGQALGEMEANAALVMAMKQGAADSVQVSLGKTSPEQAIKQVRAIGLLPGDYTLEKVAGDTFLTVSASGMDRLAKPVNREDVQQVKRNLSIIRGDHDEDGWLPLGVANRPDLAMDVKPGVAESFAHPFQPGADLHASLRDYIGAHAADGDAPADILADIQSADFFIKAGDHEAYRAALDEVAPLKGADGKMQRAEALADTFDKYADDYVGKLGGERSTLNRQKFAVDQKSVDALHRALADTPEGVAAYKQVGELTPQDQGALRNFFHANIARESPEAGQMRAELEKLTANEPERTTTDMFGDEVDNPEWKDWRATRDNLSEKLNASSLTWSKYVKIMGGPAKAHEAVQDVVRSKVAKAFVDAHNKLRPDAPIKLGKSVIRNNLDHLDAVDPEAMAARLAKQKELIDSMRERVGGKYASGSVKEKMAAAQEQKAAFEQSQMGFFSSEDAPKNRGLMQQYADLASDERHTLGHAAERQIAGMMGVVGQNFKPGQPTKLWNVSMSGKYAAQQRAVKLIAANKRVVLAAGAGCVHGATILRCEKTGVERTVYSWWLSGELPWVLSFDEKSGRIVKEQASDIFIKSFEGMLEVGMESGSSIVVAGGHRFMTQRGWVCARDLLKTDSILSFGDKRQHNPDETLTYLEQNALLLASCDTKPDACDLALHQSSLGEEFHRSTTFPARVVSLFLDAHQSMLDGFSLGFHRSESFACSSDLPLSIEECARSVRPSDVLRSNRTGEDCQGDCLTGFHQCDEQPQSEPDSAQSFAPSQCGAQGCSQLRERLDEKACAQEHSLVCQLSFRRSKMHSSRLTGRLLAVLERQADSLYRGLAGSLRRTVSLFSTTTGDLRGKGDEVLPLKSSESDVFLPWYEKVREVKSYGSGVVFDMTIPVYHNYFAHGMLHHNSGKTNMMLGAHAHLAGLGKVKRSIMMVPSIVQGQFNGEALRLLEPGKFKTHIQPGASQAERIAAYKDADTHICVMTHQSFRDDMIRLGSKHAGIDESAMTEKLQGMTPAERKAWVAGVMEKEGIHFDASFVDEAHDTLNRAGKENSSLANVVEAVGHHTPYHVYASGDPIKNDASEVHSMLQKMDPDRYADRNEFMRRYGADTIASKQALQREMARYVFPTSITPDVKVDRKTETVPLSEGQKAALGELDKHLARARTAHRAGKVDVEAAKAISPSSFEGVPESEHEKVAAALQKSVGILKSSAINRIINSHPDNAKVAHAVAMVQARPGKQGVIFARNRDSIEQYRKALEAAGKRVVTITGSDSAAEKDKKRRMFNPEKGEAQADVLIASDAGAVGMNLQSGQYLIQHDVSMTAKTHSQRQARLNRIGQKQNIELIDLVGDHREERKARDRLAKKYELKDMMASPLDSLDDTGVAWHIKQRMQAQQQDALF